MSEEALQSVIERLASDEDFARRIRNDPVSALSDFELSTVELFALSCADEDALRRLLGTVDYSPSADFRAFRDISLPAFERAAIDEMLPPDGESAAAGTRKTTHETSHTVTVCCW